MWLPFCVGLFAVLYVSTYGDDFLDEHCKDKPDGVYEPGCKAYILCTNGTANQVFCLNGQVFNFNTNQCDDPQNVPPPCGVRMNCTGLANGRYPDLAQECKFFYTCNNGQFLGHNKCPDGLVFNPALGICDWANNIPPPCGTKE